MIFSRKNPPFTEHLHMQETTELPCDPRRASFLTQQPIGPSRATTEPRAFHLENVLFCSGL
jgi:hypothetical protein